MIGKIYLAKKLKSKSLFVDGKLSFKVSIMFTPYLCQVHFSSEVVTLILHSRLSESCHCNSQIPLSNNFCLVHSCFILPALCSFLVTLGTQ